MGKIGKNIANFLRTTAVVSVLGTPLFFTGCKKPDNDVPPKVKSIEQYVELDKNGVDILYSAKISNVEKAKLNIKKEGVLISTEEISDVTSIGGNYKKTYSYSTNKDITKGDYEFTIASENSADNLQKTNYTTIVDFPTTVNINNSNIDVNQNAQLTLPLVFDDKNPEDHPIHAVSATASQGQATLDGDNLKIKAPSNYYGPYQLELQYGSTEGGLEKKTLQGNVMKGKIKVNFFDRPNPGLNHYGSGDANKNGDLTLSDWSRMNEIYAGTFSDPSDTGLFDRIDVNGDGKFDEDDIKIVYDRVNGLRTSLPGEWEKITPEQRFDWVLKMFDIDKTSNIAWTPQFDCTKFAFQTNINFSGYNQEDISNIRTFYSNFNFSDNGRFNLPLYELQLAAYDSQGNPTAGHMINIIFIYNTAPDYSSTMRIEPQHDTPNPDIGFEGYLAPFAANSELYICGSPINSTVPNEIEPVKYITYSVKDKVVTLKEVNPDIELVTQRGK